MVSSLDGMIAKKDNSVSWFETSDFYEKGAAEPDIPAFLKTIDCYIMGSRTYEHALELSRSYGWAYGDIPTIVMSQRNMPIERQNIERYSGDLGKLFKDLLTPKYKNVWLVGGPTLAKAFIHANLADEIRLSVLPIILGDGLPFLSQVGQELPLHLKDVTAYKNGMLDLVYEVARTPE
jgi:dihydrofolate reductase